MSEAVRTLPEALALTDIAALNAEIDARRKARYACVGWLYPSVLADEVGALQERINTLKAMAAAMGAKHDR